MPSATAPAIGSASNINDDLRDELEKARAFEEPLRRELKQQRGVINDIHRKIAAVSKGFEKRPS